MQAQLMAQEGTRQRKRQLQKIEGALRRIEAGEYGKCFICEEELDAPGLSVDPTTTRCLNCVEDGLRPRDLRDVDVYGAFWPDTKRPPSSARSTPPTGRSISWCMSCTV